MKLLNKILIALIAVLFAASVVTTLALKKATQNVTRLEANQTALFESVKLYRTADSLNAAGVQKLTIERNELQLVNSGLAKTIESLDIKMRRVLAASETAIETEYKPATQIRDSIVYRDRQPADTLKCLKYADPWINVSGCFHVADTQFVPVIITRDTIHQVIHRVPKKIWFIRYGAKGIRQEMVCKNPWGRPVFTEYIEFK